MATGIIALITAIAIAIPTIWAWRVSAAKKKAIKDLEKHKQDIRRAVTTGDIDKVRREMAKWL